MKPAFFLFGFVGIVVFLLMMGCIVTVPVGHRGIVTRFGAVTGQVRSEGTHFKIPFIEGNKNIDVRRFNASRDMNTGSSENQTVKAVVSAGYHIDPENVSRFYQEIATEPESIVQSRIEQAVKDVVATIPASQVLQSGPKIRSAVEAQMRDDLKSYHIVLDNVVVNDLDYEEAFNLAIEAKAKAEQDALAAKNKLEQSKYEAQQAIEVAKGKAEAQRIEGEALKSNPELIQLRSIEKWKGDMPTYWGSGALPFINVK